MQTLSLIRLKIHFLRILKIIHVPLDHSRWQQVIIDEMQDLASNGTWELVHLSFRKKIGGRRWVYDDIFFSFCQN